MNPDEFQDLFQGAVDEVEKVVVGQEDAVRQLLVALLAGGHVLIEGVPGLGKTLLARCLSKVLGLNFKRIQFTPDLMPSDITGGNVYDARDSQFTFHPGPVFAQLVVADEINRAPAKTQSALLEAMQEGTVTVDGASRSLPSPFFVVATQNSVESQGTYPLPEAQLDRFLFQLILRHPEVEAEGEIVARHLRKRESESRELALEPCLDTPRLLALREHLLNVRVDPSVIAYITQVVSTTRTHPSVSLGASPRASIGLAIASRGRAASEGRDFVIPDDVKECAPTVLRHRLLLYPDAELEDVTPDDCVESILREVPVPRSQG